MSTSQSAAGRLEVQVLWSRIITLVEEQAKALIFTAFSNILSEGADLSAGVFDTQGRMIAQAVTGTPGHINVTGVAVKNFLKRYPPGSLSPGDVLISNDPYGISGHVLDITVVTPVFDSNGQVLAYVASICHAVDMGGLGYTSQASSTYEEGLYVPYLKLYVGGTMNPDIAAIIEANVRSPIQVMGDLRAQAAANSVAVQGILDVMEEFGLSEIDSFGGEVMARTESAMRAAIRDVRNGSYRHEIVMDGAEGDIVLRVRVDVSDEDITIDFDSSSPASHRGLNVCLNYTVAYAIFAVKAALAPDVPNNEGSFQPVHVHAPEGCIVHAVHPQPTQARHVVGQVVAEVVLGALAEVIPEQVITESAAPLWILNASGQTKDDTPFSFTFFTSGGMGASADGDGLHATMFPSGARGTPVEIVEVSSPVMFHQKELRADSGGPGRHRGGCGQEIRFGVTTGRSWRLPTMYGHISYPAAGLAGGLPGARGIARRNGSEPLDPMGSYSMEPDDVVSLSLPGGGGYGPPAERDPAAIEDDVRNGYVSEDAARKDYGPSGEGGTVR
ncbi:MAG: hydantoinase B/oxoprolinase family protein [Streptosporangiales bacterium]|nr:hydantoinase B/oxoprolinase family protein [Streptosporangiales bacterium]